MGTPNPGSSNRGRHGHARLHGRAVLLIRLPPIYRMAARRSPEHRTTALLGAGQSSFLLCALLVCGHGHHHGLRVGHVLSGSAGRFCADHAADSKLAVVCSASGGNFHLYCRFSAGRQLPGAAGDPRVVRSAQSDAVAGWAHPGGAGEWIVFGGFHPGPAGGVAFRAGGTAVSTRLTDSARPLDLDTADVASVVSGALGCSSGLSSIGKPRCAALPPILVPGNLSAHP